MTAVLIKDWLQIAVSFLTLIGLIGTVGMQLFTMVNVRKIEVATNSMKDALVASTAKASDLEGEKRGRENEVARQDSLPKT